MTTGMQIYNTSQVLLASTDMLSHFCKKSGTGSTIASTAGGDPPSMAKIAVTGTKSILAIASASTMAFAGLFGGFAYFWCEGAIGTAYTYYIFSTLEGVGTAHLGLETYNAAGDITFSSSYRPMKILEVNPGAAVTHTGKDLAVGMPSWIANELIGPLKCWDGGTGVIWLPESGDPCGDLRYNDKVFVKGGNISNSGQTLTPDLMTYQNIDISAGSSSGYDYPSGGIDNAGLLFVVDVTDIPIGSTFF